MPIDRAALGYAVGNVSSSPRSCSSSGSSQALPLPMTLTFFHFVFTDLFYRAPDAAGLFVRKSMLHDAFRMAATGVGSIGFMNISLHLISVGFYQITKLAIVPATLCAQSLLFGISTSTKIKLSLAILLLGLGLATVTDVRLKLLTLTLTLTLTRTLTPTLSLTLALTLALALTTPQVQLPRSASYRPAAVLSTTTFQLWQGSRKE